MTTTHVHIHRARDRAVAVELGEDKSRGTSGVPALRKAESTVKDDAGHDPKNGQFAKGGSSSKKVEGGKMHERFDKNGKKIKMFVPHKEHDAASHARGCVCADCMDTMMRDAAGHDPKNGQFAKGGGSGSKKKKVHSAKTKKKISKTQKKNWSLAKFDPYAGT